jgi:hypothetical protein
MAVLLNIAHVERSPKRREGAAVRLLGIFSDVSAATIHSQAHYADSEIDMVCVPSRKWAAVMRTTGASELSHLDRLAEEYKRRQREHEDEFRANVAGQRTGEVKRAPIAEAPQHTAPVSTSEPHAVPRAAEIRMQRFAVISIIPDSSTADTAEQQPALIVWGAFDSEEDARHTIRDQLATQASDVHLDVVSMYEWLPLTDLDLRHIKEEFRDDSLTDIIQARKDERNKVEQYMHLCEKRGQEPSILNIGRPEDCPGSVTVPSPLEKQPYYESPDVDVQAQAEVEAQDVVKVQAKGAESKTA